MIDDNKWFHYTFYEQMGNIASELNRAILFQNRKDDIQLKASLQRLIELLDLTKIDPKNKRRLRETGRFKEVVADWYCGTGVYKINPESLKQYAMDFAMLAVKNR